MFFSKAGVPVDGRHDAIGGTLGLLSGNRYNTLPNRKESQCESPMNLQAGDRVVVTSSEGRLTSMVVGIVMVLSVELKPLYMVYGGQVIDMGNSMVGGG